MESYSETLRAYWTVFSVVLLLFAAAFGWDRYATHQAVEAEEQQRLMHQAEIVQLRLSRRLRTTAHALDSIRVDFPWLLAQSEGPALIHRRLQAMVDSMIGVRSFLVVNGAGDVIASNRRELIGLNFREGDRYKTIRAGGDPDRLYVSAPFLSPLKNWVMSVGKMVADAQGRFDGYVLAILDPDYFSLLMHSILYAPDMRAGVVHGEGQVVFRVPDPEGLTGKDLAEQPNDWVIRHLQSGQETSVFKGVIASSGSPCLAVVRTIWPDSTPADKPLVVAVSRDRSALFAPWYRETLLRGGVLAGISLLAAVALFFYQRRWRAYVALRSQTEAAERESETRLRLALDAAHAGAWEWHLTTHKNIWSEKVWSLYGLDSHRATPSYKAWRQTVHPDDRVATESRLQEAVSVGREFELEWRVQDSGDPPRWLLSRGKPLCDGEGQLVSYIGIVMDITERKRAETALRQSEERFRRVFTNNMVPMAIWATSGVIVDANDALLDLIGYSRAELDAGRIRWDEITPSEFRERDQQALREVERQDFCVPYEKAFRRKDGQIIPILIVGGALDGLAGSGVFFALDLSGRKEAEAALRESEARLRTLVDTIPDLVWLKDPNGVFLTCNTRFEQLFGADKTRIIGRTDYDFRPVEEADFFRARDREAIAAGGPTMNEEEIVFASDGHRELLQTIKTTVHAEDGTLIGVLGIGRDITRLRKSEKELENHRLHLEGLVKQRTQELAEAQRIAQLGSWRMDLATGQVTWSEALYRIFGMDPSQPPPGYSEQTSLFTPESGQRLATAISKTLETGEPYEQELEIQRADGTGGWIFARGEVTRDLTGATTGLQGVAMNITRRKEAEQLMMRAKEVAEAANLSKSAFLANMSHEIRTPMNAVLGLAYLLERQDLPQDARDLAHKIHQAGRSLLGILNDILDFSKIESGKIAIEQVPFRLSDILDNLATIMTTTAKDKRIDLVIVPPPYRQWFLLGDPLRLGQILINLANNAIKFTDAGLVEVRIEPVERGETRVLMRFTVRDTGIGMDEEAQARLFQPFSQADVSTSRRFGGSGLGLVISRRLVELMGGRMGFDSRLGAGSTFWFELPFELMGQDERQSHRMRVLVVDDNPIVRDGLLAMVDALGWSASHAESGDAAFCQVLNDPALQGPDAAVLLDGQMPGRDGLTTARAIREALPESRWPLLLLYTTNPVEQALKSPDAGWVEAVLAKPLAPSPLYDAVIRARGRRLGEVVTPRPPASQAQRLAGRRLLVVDDSEINREVARRIFEDEGARVSLADNGREALDWLLAHPRAVDVVLMDVQMPVMDGHEATICIRQNAAIAGLPVIALTAGALRSQEVSAREAGMNAFISKPFDVEQAVAVILSLTPGQDGHRALGEPVKTPRKPTLGAESVEVEISEPSADPVQAASPSDYPGLTIERGLTIWKDVEVYRRYLRRAAREYGDTAQRIATAEPDAARRLAHTLRGAAGNLGLIEVMARAGELERLFLDQAASERIATATTALQSALDTALESIARFAPEVSAAPREVAGAGAVPDPAQMGPFLRAALAAFGDFDPMGAEPSVTQLERYLPSEQLALLRKAIEDFDATGGKVAIRELASRLRIPLEEDP